MSETNFTRELGWIKNFHRTDAFLGRQTGPDARLRAQAMRYGALPEKGCVAFTPLIRVDGKVEAEDAVAVTPEVIDAEWEAFVLAANDHGFLVRLAADKVLTVGMVRRLIVESDAAVRTNALRLACESKLADRALVDSILNGPTLESGQLSGGPAVEGLCKVIYRLGLAVELAPLLTQRPERDLRQLGRWAVLAQADDEEVEASFTSLHPGSSARSYEREAFFNRFFGTDNPAIGRFAVRKLSDRDFHLAKHALWAAANHGFVHEVEQALHRSSFRVPDVTHRLPPEILLGTVPLRELATDDLGRLAERQGVETAPEFVAEIGRRLQSAVASRWSRRDREDDGERFDKRTVNGWAERDRLAAMLPLDSSRFASVWPDVSPLSLVHRLYDDRPIPTARLWDYLPVAARTVWVHRALWSEDGLADGHPSWSDPDPLVRAVIDLYAKGDPQSKRQVVDDAIHGYLLSCLSHDGAGPIDLRPLLPACSLIDRGIFFTEPDRLPEVAHCEGRILWESSEGAREAVRSRAWCPRLKGCCTQMGAESRGDCAATGARLWPVEELLWHQASLVEVFARLGISDASRNEKDTFILAIAAYVNRLNDIRTRLRCEVSGCDKWLRPDLDYAKNHARYNKTVFECPEHAGKRYFNHCWRCQETIDSKFCRSLPAEFLPPANWSEPEIRYACIQCGAGPYGDHSFVGSFCPNRGCTSEKPMESVNPGDVRARCLNCGHTIGGGSRRNS